MNFFNHLKVINKIIIGFGTPLILMIVIATLQESPSFCHRCEVPVQPVGNLIPEAEKSCGTPFQLMRRNVDALPLQEIGRIDL